MPLAPVGLEAMPRPLQIAPRADLDSDVLLLQRFVVAALEETDADLHLALRRGKRSLAGSQGRQRLVVIVQRVGREIEPLAADAGVRRPQHQSLRRRWQQPGAGDPAVLT